VATAIPWLIAYEGGGWIPNITQHDLRDWKEKDIAEVLTTGMTPDDKVGGSMVDVVRNISQLSAEDRLAIKLLADLGVAGGEAANLHGDGKRLGHGGEGF
jgi:hypothetical protein